MRLLIIILLGFALGGCSAGSGKGLDVSGRPLSEGGDLPLAATLASIQANVFNPSCIVCHSGASAPLGLRLDAASSYTALVGVSSSQNGSFKLVAPANPDASYLIKKLEGTAAEGEQMPLGGPPVPQATIDFVRQWITDGAAPDSGGPASQPPVVVSLTPVPASASTDFPSQIAAGFDQDVDASTINDLTFTLHRSGGDAQFDNGNDVVITPAAVALSPMNARLAVMDLTGVAAVEDRYRITLSGAGTNVILSVSGLTLDGEFAGSFPSGDGTQGGDFVAEFDVQGLQASLDSIQANVFTPTCAFSGCHSGPAGPNLPAGMDLSSADASFASLVDVASIQVPVTMRVATGIADDSYLIRKLEGTAAAGSRMPLGGPFLDQVTIDVIRAWIDSGAAR
ncbi:MAG: hypothetical protein OER22_10610 [Gammaproteobacteria bacterium]|nr:hypothetical protein [Gammaproteobacteria bacterium]MDH3410585.1 hypothetical protein [Gammaproteobacteria bacterium]MDH3553053.1 hypothetical protein [Gammaproteobacteria bacterium]